MDIDSVVGTFFRGIEVSKSWHTLDAYKRNLNEFIDRRQIKDLDDFKNITIMDLYDYIDDLKKDFAPSSINQKIATLKVFFKYLKKLDIVQFNPAKAIEEVSVDQKLYVVLQENESEKLIKTSEKLRSCDSSPLRGIRNELIIKIFLETGVRAFEIEGMKFSRIRFYDKSILILGKYSIERLVYFSDETFKLLEQYLTFRNLIKIKEEDEDCLFITEEGNGLKKRMIQHIVSKYVREAEITKVSTHKLRHTCASTLKHKGYSMKQIQEKLGHKRLTTTERYVHALELQKAR